MNSYMRCSSCGVDLPNDSQFCRYCGRAQSVAPTRSGAAAAVDPARIPVPVVAPQPKRGVAGWILGSLLLLLVVVWPIQQPNRSPVPPPASQHVSQQLPVQQHRQSTGNIAFTVNAGGMSNYKCTVPAGASNVTMKGHFTASGGSGSDIQVVVVNEDEYVNWQNGHPTKTFYNSGKVTQDSISITLPSDAATYYIVFSNKFSLLTPKAVQASVDLNFFTR